MKKIWRLVLLLVFLAGIPVFYVVYQKVFGLNSGNEDVEIFIPTGSSLADVVQILEDNHALLQTKSFEQFSSWMKYSDENVKAGHYIIRAKQTNKDIISMLRSGDQTPMKLVINNVRTLQNLAGVISRYIESDSLTVLQKLQSPDIQQQYGKSPQTMMTLFLPDTYEVFWTSSPERVFDKLAKHTDGFWDKNADKLARISLTKDEAYTLASIVEQESNLAAERPRLAGVYLNRLKSGMRLQADPTVKFALQDFALKRVLLKHLEFDSPYNTYMYAGLPPGPICMPSLSSLNAVIGAEDNDFLFFCAKPGYQAGHVFAKTLAEHNNNANAYQKWLSSEGIY